MHVQQGADPSKGWWRDVKLDMGGTGLTDSEVARSCGISQVLVILQSGSAPILFSYFPLPFQVM